MKHIPGGKDMISMGLSVHSPYERQVHTPSASSHYRVRVPSPHTFTKSFVPISSPSAFNCSIPIQTKYVFPKAYSLLIFHALSSCTVSKSILFMHSPALCSLKKKGTSKVLRISKGLLLPKGVLLATLSGNPLL